MELGGKRYEISDDTIPEQPRVKTKKAERDRQTDRVRQKDRRLQRKNRERKKHDQGENKRWRCRSR